MGEFALANSSTLEVVDLASFSAVSNQGTIGWGWIELGWLRFEVQWASLISSILEILR